jgi:uncharacterized membrane protein YjjB (DUF3815 family)
MDTKISDVDFIITTNLDFHDYLSIAFQLCSGHYIRTLLTIELVTSILIVDVDSSDMTM